MAFVSLSLLGASTGTAALTPQQRAQGITVEDLNANKKTLGNLSATIQRNSESRYKFGGMLSYGLRQDLAKEREPVVSMHRLMGMASMTILDRPVIVGFDDDLANEVVTFNATLSGQFSTLGQEIIGQTHGGPMEASDVDLSASRMFEMEKIWEASNSLDLTLGSSLPTSESTQYEGVVAVPYVNLAWALGFQGGRYNITQAVSADYVFNQYAYNPTGDAANADGSPGALHQVNPDGSAGYSLTASARLGAGFRFSIGGSARVVRHLDDSVTSGIGNSQTLSWTKGFATVTLRHANGSRAEDRQTSLWFIDEYKRIVSLGLSVRF